MKKFSVIKQIFGLEYRSLAAYRMLLGLVIVGDLIDRSTHLQTFYTDQGSQNINSITLSR